MNSFLQLTRLFSKCAISTTLSKSLYSLTPAATGIRSIFSLTLPQTLAASASRQLLKPSVSPVVLQPSRTFEYFSYTKALPRYINRLIKNGVSAKKKSKLGPTEGKPFVKGVVLKTLIKKPKKPNSANRKCVRVRLSTGREATAYVPGIGHNLQEHHIVLVRGGKMQDLPGVKLKCVRGKYDLAHVKKSN